jgi:hypothetical protein
MSSLSEVVGLPPTTVHPLVFVGCIAVLVAVLLIVYNKPAVLVAVLLIVYNKPAVLVPSPSSPYSSSAATSSSSSSSSYPIINPPSSSSSSSSSSSITFSLCILSIS